MQQQDESFQDRVVHIKRSMAQDAANDEFRQEIALDICELFLMLHYSPKMVAIFESQRYELETFLEYLDQFEKRIESGKVKAGKNVLDKVKAANLRYVIFCNDKVRKVWKTPPSRPRKRDRVEEEEEEEETDGETLSTLDDDWDEDSDDDDDDLNAYTPVIKKTAWKKNRKKKKT